MNDTILIGFSIWFALMGAMLVYGGYACYCEWKTSLKDAKKRYRKHV